MTAQMIQALVWKAIQEMGAVTKDELLAMALADGAKPQNVEGQVVGVLRLLENKELITEDSDSKGGRFWKLSKKGEKEVRRAERKSVAPEQGAQYEVETVIRLTCVSLAGSIPTENTDDGRLEWPKKDGCVILLPLWWKGLFRKVFERLELPKKVADWLVVDPILLPVTTGWLQMPVPPAPGSNSGGRGISIFETLPVGTEITVRCLFPGRVIPRKKAEALWRYAGRIGFSVGKSKLGFGTFEVLRCTVGETIDFLTTDSAAN